MQLKCPVCGNKFTKTSPRHRYCTRKCFKTQYRIKQNESHDPVFICPSCGKPTKLDFTPLKDEKKWTEFHCPFCNYGVGSIQVEIECWEEIVYLRKGKFIGY